MSEGQRLHGGRRERGRAETERGHQDAPGGRAPGFRAAQQEALLSQHCPPLVASAALAKPQARQESLIQVSLLRYESGEFAGGFFKQRCVFNEDSKNIRINMKMIKLTENA